MLENILSCVNNVLIFVFLVLPGFFAKRKNLIEAQHIDGLSSIIVNFLWPAMVINIMASVQVSERLIHIALYTGLCASAIYVVGTVIALFYLKVRRAEETVRGILAFSIVFNNTGFIGIPFIQMVLGTEAGFAASIVEAVNDLFIFTVGIMLIQYGKDGQKKFDMKALLSPGFLSVIVGLIIFLLGIPLPDCLGKAVGYMANATTAMAMFLVGAQLGEMKLGELFRQKHVFEVALFRLIVIPGVMMVALRFLSPENTLPNQVLVLMSCMPCATCQAIFARQYHLDYKLATAYVMTTTVLVMLTLPVWSAMVTMVF